MWLNTPMANEKFDKEYKFDPTNKVDPSETAKAFAEAIENQPIGERGQFIRKVLAEYARLANDAHQTRRN